MRVTLIAAMDHARVIGAGGGMPWHLPADFRWFRRHTLGKPIAMGRRTFESIGRALPKRTNIVVTRSPDFSAADVRTASSLEQAMAIAASTGADELMVCGGAVLYEAAMPLAERLLVTVVHTCVEGGDTWFPAFSLDTWRVASAEHAPADADNAYATSYYILDRRPDAERLEVVPDGLPSELRAAPPEPSS